MIKRENLGNFREILDVPDLINVQLSSYNDFLQKDILNREICGLHGIFMEVFPIESFDKKCALYYKSYDLVDFIDKDPLNYIRNGTTYNISLYVNFNIRLGDIYKEEKVYMGEIPLMTKSGTFIINGAERIIINQLHRSPGFCYEKRQSLTGRNIFVCRIIPDRGVWIELQINHNDDIFVIFDKKKNVNKISLFNLLIAIGYVDTRDILQHIYNISNYKLKKLINNLNNNNYYTVNNIFDKEGNLLLNSCVKLDNSNINKLIDNDIKSLELICLLDNDRTEFIDYLLKNIISNKEFGKKFDQKISLINIYKKLWPGDPASIKNAKKYINDLFFNNKKYDLGLVGRYKINSRLNNDVSDNIRILTKNDFICAAKFLIDAKYQNIMVDDIDHLCNRRIRTVGEQLQNQCRIGLVRIQKSIKEKLGAIIDTENLKISNIISNKIINFKIFSNIIKDFFARSQLSQFMDQTNPLSELANKRRLSALGPGGLNRERAGFEVRDVHVSHYGRICPIETPEGANIGLISSMAIYSKIDKLGFLQTPYRIVQNGCITKNIKYMRADEEEKYKITSADIFVDDNNKILKQRIMCRYNGLVQESEKHDIQFTDVSPKQLVSVSTALIPFLEHDDTSRALMGSNMQRQAVPLLYSESPIVGTGLEKRIAVDTRSMIIAEESGIIEKITENKIIMDINCESEKEYKLSKFLKTNAGTCINQKSIVKVNQKILKGQIIADGSCTNNGELSLGKNLTVAFMSWRGYNYEDAIVISDKVIKNDLFTSIHITTFDAIARDTKLGQEEITADIPNISEELLDNLEINGVIKIGIEVKPGDVLVGKITPKTEIELAPEERLLRAIFGEKAANVQDSSLIVGPGVYGVVIDTKIDYMQNYASSVKTKTEIKKQIKNLKNSVKFDKNNAFKIFEKKLIKLLLHNKLLHELYDGTMIEANIIIPANRKITISAINRLIRKYKNYNMLNCDIKIKIDSIIDEYLHTINSIALKQKETLEKIDSGSLVETDIIKKVKVYIAIKRKLQVGDKMAGRHGNKGIVAKIVQEEDMPFLVDGTSVDIILNLLGVPSRMNVGQLLETHLGWAANMLNIKVSSPVFDGADEQCIVKLMTEGNKKYGLEQGENYNFGFVRQNGSLIYDGKTNVFDGKTGDKFDQRITIGKMYMMKLDHLIANKIHARSVGPYSLVTQQPLGGKAQYGGQRFGEMEVWALEAYGAAYTLQEMLTVKSDDVAGRVNMYESIIRGKNVLNIGRPESFNVLIKELQGLSLDIQFKKRNI